MTNPEQLRPHELANQILGGDYEVASGRVESRRLGDLLDRSRKVWRLLSRNKFEENEHGHATIGVEDWSDYTESSSDRVDALVVYFNDPLGNVTRLGRVFRLNSYSKATASVYIGGDRTEPLLPNDQRWDAVVGIIERAVDASYRQQSPRGRSAQ